MIRWFAVALVVFVGASVASAQNTMTITVTPDKQDHAGPLCVPLSVPAAWAKLDEVAVDVITGRDVARITGQLTAPSIMTEAIKPAKDGAVRRDLHVILTTRCLELVVHFTPIDPAKQQVARFAWTEKKGEYQELLLTLSGRAIPQLRYMNRPYNTSTKEARDMSYKVFHHLYDSAGNRLTNGGFADGKVADPKKLLYPHHRGIMYGFNKCTYGPGLKGKADTWHCTGDAHVSHEKTLGAEAGPILGRHRVLLGWFGEKNERFAEEERELTIYRVGSGTIVEFASRLKTTGGAMKLDGDPQHAGFQFRAHNDVAASSSKQTLYIHPDGSKGAMGAEKNWPKDKDMVDLPWYVVSFVLDKQRYSVCYMNRPTNPKETRFSERAYARFGGYFERQITADTPLIVNYRLSMQPGEMTADQANAQRASFAAPAKTATK